MSAPFDLLFAQRPALDAQGRPTGAEAIASLSCRGLDTAPPAPRTRIQS